MVLVHVRICVVCLEDPAANFVSASMSRFNPRPHIEMRSLRIQESPLSLPHPTSQLMGRDAHNQNSINPQIRSLFNYSVSRQVLSPRVRLPAAGVSSVSVRQCLCMCFFTVASLSVQSVGTTQHAQHEDEMRWMDG